MKYKKKVKFLSVFLITIFSTLMLSCQTSCASDKTDVSEIVPTKTLENPTKINDLTDADFEALTKILYDYLKSDKIDQKTVPTAVTSLNQPLKVILTVATDEKPTKKYIYMFVSGKLVALNDRNSLVLPIKGKFTLRTDFIVRETEIESFDSRFEINFLREYFCLGLIKDEFSMYFLPEELISLDLIDDENLLEADRLLKYLKTQPQFTQNLAYIKNLKTFDARKVGIKSFFTGGKRIIVLLKGFQHFKNIKTDDLLYAYKIAGDYLKNMVLSDGRFVYAYYPGRNRPSKSYNILRHCGTIYSMLEVYELTKDKELLKSAKKALDYAIGQMKDYTDDTVCIVEDDVLKLGGNGLAAIALSKYIEQTGDEEYLDTLKKIGKWFQLIQEKNGKFRFHKQYYSTRKIIDNPCAYYPGEALLGIMRIYALTKDESLIKTAVAGAKYIINIRDKDSSIEDTYHDHWLLYALNEIHRQEKHPEFLTKSIRIVKSMLLSMNNDPKKPEIIGSYYSNPRSTPTATRSEGILAAYRLFKDFGLEKNAAEALKAVKMSILFQLRTQFRQENVLFFPKPERVIGGFQRGPTNYSIRIDYVQHNISSIINLYKIMKDAK
ncbi:MAG: hypothetical protein K8S87_02855 [Planctomycetes bacterium]|nr:hypothetical protein [Planctomycetota bacterium]